VDTPEPTAAPNTEVRIVPFVEEALSDVVALSLRAWEPVFDSLRERMDPAVFDHFFPDWRVAQAEAVTAACLSAGMRVWTANLASSVTGFVAVKLDQDSRMGGIHMIAVDPLHQHAGIGRALMTQALEWMTENGMAVAMVETGGDDGHDPARRLYERAGFRLLPVARIS
jgi:ribosomal protein S18 acetylase RimI-like enzyme